MWGGKTNPCLNPIKIMYENWHVNTRTYLISENIAFSTKTPLILLSTFFFPRNSAIFGKNSNSTQSNSMRAVLEIF